MRGQNTRPALWAVGFGLVVTCAGCGNLSAAQPGGVSAPTSAVQSEAPPPDKTQGAVWSPAPPQPGEVVYSGLGVRTLPAPIGAVPSLSAAEAEQSTLVQDFVRGGLAIGKPSNALRLITTGDFPPGSDPPEVSVKNRLGWVLTFGDSPADYHGPVGFTPPPTPTLCDLIVILDAVNGAKLVSAQVCPGTH